MDESMELACHNAHITCPVHQSEELCDVMLRGIQAVFGDSLLKIGVICDITRCNMNNNPFCKKLCTSNNSQTKVTKGNKKRMKVVGDENNVVGCKG